MGTITKMNGIHLFFSSTIDSLSALLAAGLMQEQQSSEADIFAPSTVIVPNPALRRWLQLETARHNGMAVNIRFAFLEQGLWELLQDMIPDTSVSIIDMPFMHKLVFHEIIRHCSSNENESFPRIFRAFVQRTGMGIDEQRAWQLSGSIAGLFMEYEIHRPEMIAAWRQGKQWFPDGHAALSLEQAERTVFAGVLESAELAGQKAGATFLTLPALASMVFTRLPSGQADSGSGPTCSNEEPARPVHIFCPSQLSRFHTELICRLGQFHDVRLYSLNVCREFWEDVETDGERRARLRKIKAVDAGDYHHELPLPKDENPLLASWGKPGRETLKIFSDLEDRFMNTPVRFEAVWLDHEAISKRHEQSQETLLGRIKHAINTRSALPVSGPQDRSLQIASAPGIEREVQAVWNSIVANMEENPDLKFSDIAVLVPDMNRYRAVIQQAFDAPLHAGGRRLVPWSLVDSSALLESVYAQGVNALLGIIGGEFTRAELFRLFQNPCFMEQWSVDAAGVDTWLTWCADINIFRGVDTPFDYSSAESQGSAALDEEASGRPSLQRFSWKPGLKRLRLGKIMDGFSQSGHRSFNGLLPYQRGGSDAMLSGALSLAVEMLAVWRRQMKSTSMPVAWWKENLPELIDAFLDIPPEMRAEHGVRSALMEGLGKLTDFEIMPKPVSLSLKGILEYIKGILGGIPGGRGGYITGGVTVASLLPMRPIPFRHVYVLGLDQETFPGSDPVNPLDLVRRMRRIGDVSLPERNAFLFLETLVTVRDRLFLSWVGRDVKEDREYEPSSVITSLCSFMDFDFSITEIPLKAWSPAFLVHDRDEPHNWLHAYSPHHYALSLLEIPAEMRPDEWQKQDRPAQDHVGQAAAGPDDAGKAPEHALEDTRDDETPDQAEISHYQIVEFLRNPALFYIRRSMGLGLPGEDEAMVEDEPFALDYFGRAEVFARAVMETMHSVMSQRAVPDYDCIEEKVRHVMSGLGDSWRAPALIYEKIEQERFAGDVEALFNNEDFRQVLTELAAQGITPVANVQIGDGQVNGPVSCTFPPAITAAGLTFHAWLAWALMKDGRLQGAVVPQYSLNTKTCIPSGALEPFLFYCIGVAGGIIDPAEDFILLMPSPSGLLQTQFNACPGGSSIRDHESCGGFVSVDHVQEYLACLAADMNLFLSDMMPFRLVEMVKFPKYTGFSHESMERLSGLTAMEVATGDVTPETAEYYRYLFETTVQEKVLSVDNNRDRYADLYELVRPGVPVDVFHKVRRRFGPLWHYFKGDDK